MSRLLIILMGGDAILAIGAHYFGFLVQFREFTASGGAAQNAGLKVLILVLVLIFTTYFSELYNHDRRFGTRETFLRVTVSLFLAFIFLTILYYQFPQIMISREMLIFTLGSFGLCQFLWHERYPFLLRLPGLAQKILIVGVGPLASQIQSILADTENNCVLAGFIQPGGESAASSVGPVLGSAEDLAETAMREKVDKIVVSLSERRGVLPVRAILLCKLQGIRVVDGPSFYEQITGKLMIENINPSWFIFSDGFHLGAVSRFCKRGLDLISASILLVLSAFLFPLVALLVRIDSPGPIFFRQRRMGKGGKPFELIKFRTMRQDAEKETGAVWAQENDPRVTRIGHFLRKSRLDELPQLINVLRGDMSLVGPRPERPEFIEQLEKKIPYYGNRHCVRPGVTGWAQVRYPYGASEQDALEKLRYDLYYIKNYSLSLDILIILKTIRVVLFGQGGR